MTKTEAPYYRPGLAFVHDRGFGGYADACAPGVLALLEPVRRAGGVVLELGCGSGQLTRHLLEAGHRVVATDASPAMLDLARDKLGEAADLRLLTLPDDPLPVADAVVSAGHVLNYLPGAAALNRALGQVAAALRPGGILALDLCDLRFGEARRDEPALTLVEEDWALVTRYELPEPTRFVRRITTFVRRADGLWERDDERHDNVLVDTAPVPALLAAHGVEARLQRAFGSEPKPAGLVVVVGRRVPARGGDG